MRRNAWIALIAVAVVGLAGGLASAAGGTAPSAWSRSAPPVGSIQSHSNGQTLKVIFEDRQQQDVDLNDPGITPGDYYVFAERLVSPRGADRGDLFGKCTWHFDALQCEGVFKIDGKGDITVQAAFRFIDPEVILAVTGGTKHYQNVRGEGHFTQFPDGRFGVVFHLLP